MTHSGPPPYRWILYGTCGCHLCELAAALVRPALAERGESWCEVDIADDDDLVSRYGVRIPVLCHPGSARELGWPFDAERLRLWLEITGSGGPPTSD